jgi:hypothetical protein
MSGGRSPAGLSTGWPFDECEGVAEAGRERVFGGEGVLAGADLDGAVAAGGADEFPDGPAGAVPGEPGDGEGGEDGAQVGVEDSRLRW